MKNLFILLLISLLGKSVFGQEMHSYTIDWGKETKTKKIFFDRMIAITDEGYYALSYKYRTFSFDYYLTKYNNKYNTLKSEEAFAEIKKEEADVFDYLFAGGNLYQFSTLKDNKIKKTFLLVQTVNLSTMQPNKDIKKISTIDYSDHSRWNNGDFQVIASKDSSKILVVSVLPYDKDEPEMFGIDVYNENMELLWNKKVKLPYADNLFDLSKFIVSNSGGVYVLGKLY